MSFKEKLDELWNNPQDDLEGILKKSIQLLDSAIKRDENIPLNISYDILLSANSSLGFGSTFNEARLLLLYLKRGLNEFQNNNIDKIERLTCLITGVILTLLSVDEASSSRQVPKLMKIFDLSDQATRCQIINKMMHETSVLVGKNKISFWTFELISFLITQYCFLEQFDKIGEEEIQMLENIKLFIKKIMEKPDKNDLMFIREWKERWSETSDYYRFTTMMIFGKTTQDSDAWLVKAKSILED